MTDPMSRTGIVRQFEDLDPRDTGDVEDDDPGSAMASVLPGRVVRI